PWSGRTRAGWFEKKSAEVVMSTGTGFGPPACALGFGNVPSARSLKVSPVRSWSLPRWTFRDWRPSTTVTIPSPSGLVVTPLTGSTAEIVILPTVLAVSTPFFGDTLPTSAIHGSLEVQTTTDPMFAELPSSRVARALTLVSVPTG